jgi:hypothetical protein
METARRLGGRFPGLLALPVAVTTSEGAAYLIGIASCLQRWAPGLV